MKIFAAGIATETNTFSPIRTRLEDFTVERGEEAQEAGRPRAIFDLHALWGMPARARGDDFVFSLMAFAQPAGLTIRSAYESLRDEVLADLSAAMPVDLVLLMLHGAMLAEGYDDCEQDLIRRVREIVGPNAVIGVELDLHCHLSEAKIERADVVIAYKEYPHDDVNDRARELFELAIAAKEGRISPTMSLFDCRMVGLYPTTREPMRSFVKAMIEAEQREGVLSVSFAHGFQFADLPHTGAKMLVVTDGDRRLGADIAQEFGRRAFGLRREIGLQSVSLPMDEAFARAFAAQATPVVVADQADNVGGGAPGDSTFALRWLLEHGAEGVAIAFFYDPDVVRTARAAGVGATISVQLGGKLGAYSGEPVSIEAQVLSVRESYLHAFPQRSGEDILFRAGDVVALHCRGIDLVVSSERCQCFAPSIFSDMGIDPARKRVLIPKSSQHFYGAFAPIAADIIYMAAPGAVTPNPRTLTYRRLNTAALYPWTENPPGMST